MGTSLGPVTFYESLNFFNEPKQLRPVRRRGGGGGGLLTYFFKKSIFLYIKIGPNVC